MKVVGIIPARYESSRFPGKPLAKILGKPLIIHVCEKVAKALGSSNTFVATDSDEIANIVRQCGYQTVMTSSKHKTGTDRLCEANLQIEADIVINVQGDEPLIRPEDIIKVLQLKEQNCTSVINAYAPILMSEDPSSLDIPKMVINEDNELLFASRSLIPNKEKTNNSSQKYFKQVCIYAFNKSELELFATRPEGTSLEKCEDIEILRFLELGKKVKMVRVEEGSLAVDRPEDINKVENAIRQIQ